MRQFHTTSDKAASALHAALLATALMGALLLLPLLRGTGDRWIAIISPAIAFATAVYLYVRLRGTVHRPVLEITPTHLRWRKPSNTAFADVALDSIVSVRLCDGKLRLIQAGGLYQEVPIDDLHLREGRFAASMIEAELERHLRRIEKYGGRTSA